MEKTEKTEKTENTLHGHFGDRLYGEYQAYRASVLGCSNTEIFSRCYEIDVFVNFYEILAEKSGELTDDMICRLLHERDILQQLYDSWLKKDDSNYAEMERHVMDEIEKMKGDVPYGKMHDKAA